MSSACQESQTTEVGLCGEGSRLGAQTSLRQQADPAQTQEEAPLKLKRHDSVYRKIKGVEHKLCTGTTHRQGRFVPVTEFYTRKLRSGKVVPRPECKACEFNRCYPGAAPRIPYQRIKFAVEELVRRLGQAETARQIGISTSHLWEWRHHEYRKVKKSNAVAVLTALHGVRNAGLVRHRDSIQHGATARGRPEKVPTRARDFYTKHETREEKRARLDADAERKRQARANMTDKQREDAKKADRERYHARRDKQRAKWRKTIEEAARSV